MTDRAVKPSEAMRHQHRALTHTAGFADIGDRAQVEILGRDRAQVLHGLCTNDIKGLRSGQGCEAFLTSGQGRTIGYVYVFCQAESLVVESVPGAGPELVRHLGRYVIREDVRFVDRSGDWGELLISGPEAESRLRGGLSVEPPVTPWDHVACGGEYAAFHLRRVPFLGPDGFFLAAPRDQVAALASQWIAKGLIECGRDVLESARIEAGTPLFGRDITDDNLPQEVDRTAQAVSFRKGCYLGQETVARLDALGHVNRTLCGLVFTGETVPPPGAEIQVDGKLAARVTSSCWSIRLDAPLALAYVRRGQNEVGTRIPSRWGEAQVVRLAACQ